MSLPLEATQRGRLVTVAHATDEELSVLAATTPLMPATDTLESWSLIAIRGLQEGGIELHALGWRAALSNTWITFALSAVDLAAGAAGRVRTSSGHVYRLGRFDSRDSLRPLLLEHLGYALHRWDFVDLRWSAVAGGGSQAAENTQSGDVGSGGCDGR